jgi:type I restriction-modification system DNA methylase subunit
MSAPREITDLIDRFSRNAESYRSGHYGETQVRREFIDPFFKCLGWDIDNTHGFAEAYKDVIHEDAIKVGGVTKAPDYCFRVGGMRKFFLEAKRPSVNVKNDPEPAFQLRRYAWSARLPLSILTDFEEFAVYDCRIKPAQSDKAAAARIRYLTFPDYAEQWDSIAASFSKDAVLKGSFDKYAETTKLKKGTATVDAAFLREIEGWRELLAKNIALRNPDLSQRELNYAVQVTIDRILFLRMCEDRGVELYGQLAALQNGTAVYGRMRELFRKADERYNSGLFHFTKEASRSEPPDELTSSLVIDDKALKEILKSLYYPESPYEFSVLPAEILGQVYEQFLGKVIRLTSGHRAVVEEKPEVRKAGGVYYTPTYIVDYIVKNTVGKLLEGKTPRQAAKLKVLDPACGSGSFLLGAYQYLLDWHRDRYIEAGTAKPVKELFQGRGGAWHLTSSEKKRILLNNIYGVDIDPQAVEVTKLSLLLKVLEGESHERLDSQLLLFHERALPDLGSNIKCGNSLIGPDFYDNEQATLFDEEDRYRINVFDWQAEFPAIMKAGGFDAVIGNPPYVRIQMMQEWAPNEVEYYENHYVAASAGNYDIYVVFVEKAVNLLRGDGRLGFILPHKFFNAHYGAPLRKVLANGRFLNEIVHFGDSQVFDGATTYTCLMFLNRAGSNEFRVCKVDDLTTWTKEGRAEEAIIQASKVSETEWNFAVGKNAGVLEKLEKFPVKLSSIAKLFVGLQTDADKIFILEAIEFKDNQVRCQSSATGQEHWFEKDHLKPFLKGSLNVRRYRLANLSKLLIFPYEMKDGKSVLIEPGPYRKRYPLTWSYLEKNRDLLVARNKGRMGDQWYGYVYKKNHALFTTPKLLVPSIALGSCFAADLEGAYYFVGSGGGGGGGYGIVLNEGVGISNHYLLGLLNSKLLSAFLRSISTPYRGGYVALNRQYIGKLPIRMVDRASSKENAAHDKVEDLVRQMLTLHKQLSSARMPHDKSVLLARIGATDRQIDKIVYELYGLTSEEIQIVENAGNESASSVDADEKPTVDENGDAATYTPYQPALDAGISEEWDRKNARRLDLAKRESRDQLTPDEKVEFAELQETVLAYFESKFPRPPLVDDRLEKLEQKYKNAKNS